ncbi:MAG: hypothetical protein HY238_03165 [Acidobacteria bacterium]|nr:hypothetical protein [Acidobacteriota bacterium]
MTAATHAAVAAVIAGRFRSLAVALALSFGTHFVLDAIYHFEAVYPVSVPAHWSYERTMVSLYAGMLLAGAPVLVWIRRKSRQVCLFACYAFFMSALAFEPLPLWRLLWAALLTLIWCLVTPTAAARRWAVCTFAAYLPDCLKRLSPAFARFHDAAHYSPGLDLGDWVSLLGRGRWKLNVNTLGSDPYYLTGYAVEVVLEMAILCGCLWWLVRNHSLSVTDLPPVHHQTDPVDE